MKYYGGHMIISTDLYPICKNCGEDFSHRIYRETTENWHHRHQCWGENPSYSYWCGECENEIELEEVFL